MIRAIQVPQSMRNKVTGTWEVPGHPELHTPKVKPVIISHPIFGGETTPIRAPWWNDVRSSTPKGWKHQSSRGHQYYRIHK